jgi:hypothetical protein
MITEGGGLAAAQSYKYGVVRPTQDRMFTICEDKVADSAEVIRVTQLHPNVRIYKRRYSSTVYSRDEMTP